MVRLTGACHCGAVSVSLPAPPAEITRCNCTLCSKLGVTWGYYPPADVILNDAPLDEYRRADVATPSLAFDRCATCGCTIRWRSLVERDPPSTGINMNLFDVAGIAVRHHDGRSHRK